MLVVGGCEAHSPAKTPAVGGDAEPAAPGAPNVPGPTNPPLMNPPPTNPPPPSTPPAPPPGSSELGPQFPFVRIWTRTSFAHDHGDMTTIERVEVAGKPCPPEDVLASIVAHWQGWTAAGGRSDEDVLRTTQAFVEAWDAQLNVETVTDATAPADLASILGRDGAVPRVPGGSVQEPALVYHPPRYELREDGGERFVVASYFVKGHISQRGQHWSYVVSAFRVTDGARHTIPPGSTLPRPRGFSEGG